MTKILTMLLLALCSTAVFAQAPDSTELQTERAFNSWFGIKAGVNFSDVYGDDKAATIGQTNKHTNFQAGVFANIGLNEYFAIRPELVYARKGYERSDSVFRFDYLEVPILAVVNITRNISVHAGPQINAMVSAKQEGKEVEFEEYNTFDYGLAAGAEVRVFRFVLGGRYNFNLENLLKTDRFGKEVEQDVHARALQAYFAFLF